MQLSDKALRDLKIALDKSYGESFANDFTDTDLNKIGVVILTGLVESLKTEIATSEACAN